MAYELSPINLRVTHVKTTEKLLEIIAITEGAVYLCTDTGNMYYDTNDERRLILSSVVSLINQSISETTTNLESVKSDVETIKSNIERYIKIKEFVDNCLVWYYYTDGEQDPEEDEYVVPEEFDDYLFWYLYTN